MLLCDLKSSGSHTMESEHGVFGGEPATTDKE